MSASVCRIAVFFKVLHTCNATQNLAKKNACQDKRLDIAATEGGKVPEEVRCYDAGYWSSRFNHGTIDAI